MKSDQPTTELWNTMRRQVIDKSALEQASAYSFDYLDTVHDREVFPSNASIEKLASFDETLPDQPADAEDILQILHEVGSPATVAQGGGRYFGFVNGGIIPVALAARWLADTWDQNAALYVISPIAAKLEHICETWLVDLLGLPTGTAAGFVSGTSTATMCGLAAGRNTLLSRLGWDVIENGLFGGPQLRVVMSEQAHGSVYKALALLGIGKASIELVPADAQGRFDATKMPPLDARTLLILQAGNVNSGAFDPFVALCEQAQQAGAWVHIDGAFGLLAAACEETKLLTEGIELADSWSVDGHKTLNIPYDSGIILCKDRDSLVSAMQASGDYIQYSDQRDGMLYTPEMSRRARSIELWATLKALGRNGIDSMVTRLCQNATMFAEELAAQGFHILNDVVFNQVLVACQTSELTLATLKQIQQDGECWCGGSRWQGEPVIRISVSSWATTAEDVQRSVAAFVSARQIAQEETIS